MYIVVKSAGCSSNGGCLGGIDAATLHDDASGHMDASVHEDFGVGKTVFW